MTRKDFELIALTLRAGKPPGSPRASAYARRWEGLGEDFTLSLQSTNPRFDAKRFLQACGVSDLVAEFLASKQVKTIPQRVRGTH